MSARNVRPKVKRWIKHLVKRVSVRQLLQDSFVLLISVDVIKTGCNVAIAK
jgi:hypothetical protein